MIQVANYLSKYGDYIVRICVAHNNYAATQYASVTLDR